MSISITGREARPARRRSLLPFHAGAALDVLVGIELLLSGPALATWFLPGQAALLGVASGTVLRALDAVLLLVGADTLACARAGGRLRRFLPVPVAAHGIRVAASVAVLALDAASFSTAGIVAVARLAPVVAALAVFQWRALDSAA